MEYYNRFKPFTLIYYLILLVGTLWAMQKWIIIPLMGWTEGGVKIGHIMTMWIVGLMAVCAAAVYLTKEIMKKDK